MPPRPLTWRRLVPGLTALGGILVTAVAILAFARVGAPSGPTYRIYIVASEARGVIDGTEVWVAGQSVGRVRSIAFRPISGDTLDRLIMAVDVEERARSAIRGDSRVRFQSGGTPIGETIVAIAMGSEHSPALRPGDTLHSHEPQIDPDSVRAIVSAAAAQIPVLLSDARALGTNFRRALGGGSARAAGAPRLREVAARVERLSERLGSARGTIPRLLADSGLLVRARRAVAHADSLLLVANGGYGSLQHVRRDDAILQALTSAQHEIATIQMLMLEERGTAGRLAHDDALKRQIDRLEANLRAAITDAQRRPGHWIGF